jgi:hypothetical protein
MSIASRSFGAPTRREESTSSRQRSRVARALMDRGGSFESFGFFQGGGAPVTLDGPERSHPG